MIFDWSQNRGEYGTRVKAHTEGKAGKDQLRFRSTMCFTLEFQKIVTRIR